MAVVTVKAEDGERKRSFHVMDLASDIAMPNTESSALLSPARCDVDCIDGDGIRA